MSDTPAPRGSSPETPPWLWWLFGATIFVSAFLLFQVQPMISKIILPWFGGSPAVWTTCLLFFQVLLVVGYGYAFLLSSRTPAPWQGVLHMAPLALALGSLLFFPPSDYWKPNDPSRPPALQIFLLLAACVGMSYFVLSTTGPLLQRWFSHVFPDQPVYRLYALSNIGSLGALLSYPFLFEPLLTTGMQGGLWAGGFLVFSLLCGTVGFMLWRLKGGADASVEASGELLTPTVPAPSSISAYDVVPLPEKKKHLHEDKTLFFWFLPAGIQSVILGSEWMQAQADSDDEPVELGPDTFLIWLILPAVATVILMAVTTHVCQDITPIPLLWVVPLSLYLLTFIICFDAETWYVRPLFALGAILSTLTVGTMMIASQVDTMVGGFLDKVLGQERFHFFSWKSLREEIVFEAGAYFAMVFFVCMVCHGELARRKPDSQHLTLFFFLISVGGALGGLYVALICPLIYDSYLELYQVIVAGLLIGLMVLVLSGLKTWLKEMPARIAIGALGISLVTYLGMTVYSSMHSTHVYRARTFYGVLTVVDEEYTDDTVYGRSLRNGRILHGFQWAPPTFTIGQALSEPLDTVEGEKMHLKSLLGKTLEPTTYYNYESGFGQCMIHYSLRRGEHMRMGVVGLGTGTAACYAAKGNYCAFYEINDQVEKIAREYFTFIPKCMGDVEIKIGDARLTLEQELQAGKPQRFDVLALDAFSGDAIPAHLLTKESFKLYLQHVDEKGTIAVHVSNRYLDLIPVVAAIAEEHKLKFIRIEADDTGNSSATSASTWVLVTRDLNNLPDHLLEQDATDPKAEQKKILWTDDWSPLWPILKTKIKGSD